MSYYGTQVDQAQAAILNLIRSWDGWHLSKGQLRDALEGAAHELAGPAERDATQPDLSWLSDRELAELHHTRALIQPSDKAENSRQYLFLDAEVERRGISPDALLGEAEIAF